MKGKVMVKNKHEVPVKQWKRWTEHARGVFNVVMETMEDQSLFLHPKAEKTTAKLWHTTRWNAAWVAADACDGYVTRADGPGRATTRAGAN